MKTILMQYGFTSQESEKILFCLFQKYRAGFKSSSLNERIQRLFLFFSSLGVKSDTQIKKAILKNPSLLIRQTKTLLSNIEKTTLLLGVEKQDFVKACLKQIPLFYQSPETINQNVEKSASLLGIEKQDFIKACLTQPPLFYQLPETINRNVQETASLLGIAKQDFVKICLKLPPLFERSSQKIQQHIEEVAQLLKLKKADVVKVYLRQVSLFGYAPETLHQNVMRSSLLLGLKKEEFISMAVSQPVLFASSPDTLYRKYKFIRRFYIQDVIRIDQQIRGSIGTREHLKAYLMKQPNLLMSSLDNLACKMITAMNYNRQNSTQKAQIGILLLNNKTLSFRLNKISDKLKRHKVVQTFLKKQKEKHRG